MQRERSILKYMGKSRVSIVDVAKAAGVSYQTVSRVINNSQSVKEQTRQKVLETIEKLGYYPSQNARSLKTQHSHFIGIIASQTKYAGPINTIVAIESMARKHNLYVTLTTVDESELDEEQYAQIVSHFLPLGIEALVVVAPTESMVQMALADKTDIPRVIITAPQGVRDLDVESLNYRQVRMVGIDPSRSIDELAKALRADGVRKTYLFSGPEQWRDAFTRKVAWTCALKRAAMRFECVDVGDWTAQCGYEHMKKLVNHEGSAALRGCAVVCANDLIAMGCYRALSEAGLSIPGDVSVVGFDDMPGTDSLIPALTTINPQYFSVGELAMREVLDLAGYEHFDMKERAAYASVGGMNAVYTSVVWGESTRQQ